MFEECMRWCGGQGRTEAGSTARRLETVGWALFFIWVGFAWLTNVAFGVGLLGVGLIILGGQVARNHFHLKLEGFWVIVGLLFVVGSLWELYDVELSLGPVLLIVAGVALLVSALRRGSRSDDR